MLRTAEFQAITQELRLRKVSKHTEALPTETAVKMVFFGGCDSIHGEQEQLSRCRPGYTFLSCSFMQYNACAPSLPVCSRVLWSLGSLFLSISFLFCIGMCIYIRLECPALAMSFICGAPFLYFSLPVLFRKTLLVACCSQQRQVCLCRLVLAD